MIALYSLDLTILMERLILPWDCREALGAGRGLPGTPVGGISNSWHDLSFTLQSSRPAPL